MNFLSHAKMKTIFLKSLTPFLIIFTVGHLSLVAAPARKSNFSIKNITQTPEHFEINPTFVEGGQSIMYLVFDGDLLAPNPWDYRLCKTDINGYSISYLSEPGVINYRVSENGYEVLVLKKVLFLESTETEFSFCKEIDEWEIWALNLRSDEERLVEKSKNRSLSEGYKLLGMGGLPDFETGEYVSVSPLKSNEIFVKREDDKFRFYHQQRNEPVFSTEIWKSYSDIAWVPPVVWIDDTSFLTIRFKANSDSKFPQSAGLFSIIKFDLKNDNGTVLYTNSSLNPFPKFSFNPVTRDLFFQNRGDEDGLTELWKLNLRQGDAEILYQVKGELGQARFNRDGTRLIFTELLGQQSEIIRLDLKAKKLERLVGR